MGVQPASAESFSEILRQIADSHPQVQAAISTTAAGRADVSAARANMRPQLELGADVGWSRSNGQDSESGGDPVVRASQLLYDGGRTHAEVLRRRLRVDLMEDQEQQVLSDLSGRLAEAWGEWARQGALLAISEQQIAALGDLHDMVREIARFDRGREADVVLVGTRLAQAVSAAEARRLAQSDALALIQQIAATPITPEGDLPPVELLLPASLEDALALVDAAPRSRISDLQAQEAEASVQAARAWWRPQVALEAVTDADSGFDNEFEVRLRTTMTTFNGGGGSAQLASARASATAARLESRYLQQALRDEVRRQWQLAARRREQLPQLESLVVDTDRSRQIVYEQFRLGRRSVLDLLSFETERFNARSQLESERREVALAQYRLLAAVGRLAPTLLPERRWEGPAR